MIRPTHTLYERYIHNRLVIIVDIMLCVYLFYVHTHTHNIVNSNNDYADRHIVINSLYKR